VGRFGVPGEAGVGLDETSGNLDLSFGSRTIILIAVPFKNSPVPHAILHRDSHRLWSVSVPSLGTHHAWHVASVIQSEAWLLLRSRLS
jgi:hypothetical protein